MTTMTKQETLEVDVPSLLKKYTYEWSRFNEKELYRRYRCDSCKEVVLNLDDDVSILYPGSTERVKELKILIAHHETKHGTKPCQFCGEFMTSRGMKRHQQSQDCIAQSRKFTMRQKGYEPIDLGLLDEMLADLKEQMEKYVEWDDPTGFAFIDDAERSARYRFMQGLGVVVAKSHRGATYSGPDGQQHRDRGLSWLREEWAPWDVCHYLNLLSSAINKRCLDKADYLSEVSKFMEASEAERGAMIGGMELCLN